MLDYIYKVCVINGSIGCTIGELRIIINQLFFPSAVLLLFCTEINGWIIQAYTEINGWIIQAYSEINGLIIQAYSKGLKKQRA